MRELEAGDCDAALRDWEGDSAGADGELQHGPVPGQFGEQVDRGVQHVGLEHVGHGFVIAGGRVSVPEITARHGHDSGAVESRGATAMAAASCCCSRKVHWLGLRRADR